ncbi:MAG: hypothetical protein MUC87_01825 [Bacteroidia bacterium]|jgi:hypothetical protein|nr:hypothetical protein [Bacteroidia bacterium]
MIYVAVEGHGELGSMDNLLHRLKAHINVSLQFKPVRRHVKLQIEEGLKKVIDVAEQTESVTGILIIRDEDDKCPKEAVPEIMGIIRKNKVKLPVAFVLLYREYETLFIPCLTHFYNKEATMESGRKRVLISKPPEKEINPEARRDAKGYVSRFFKDDDYKPTLHQLPLTRLIDFRILDNNEVPSYGTLKRALNFLANPDRASVVYPDI